MVLSYSLRQRCMILSLPQNFVVLPLLLQNHMVLSIHFRTAWSSLLSSRTAWSSSLWLPCLGLNPSTHIPLQTHFRLLLQSVTPASILVFFQLYWAAIVSLGRCGPMAWSQSSPSSHAGPVTGGVASQYHLGWNLVPSPWLKAWAQLFNISMKPVKGYRCVKWPHQGLVAKLLLPKTALNGPVSCVPSPLAQACGGEDILHTFF